MRSSPISRQSGKKNTLTTIALIVGLITGLMSTYVMSGSNTQTVNPELLAFQKRFEDPKLIKLGNRVYAAVGYDYSNFSLIEGDDGVIVVDAGWFPGAAQRALNDFREISDKPVKAIIYTHSHTDHTGGSIVFQQASSGEFDVYAPDGFNEWLSYNNSHQVLNIWPRVLGQMGLLLPAGEDGVVGAGIGPSPRFDGTTPQLVEPTVIIHTKQTVNIAGVAIELIPAPGDIPSHLSVWLPEDEILFSGDNLGGTLPYISTPRFEPDRDPMGFVHSLEIAQSLSPRQLVPGHGRALMSTEDVNNVLQANIDIIRFLNDQVERYTLKGYSADEIIDALKIPEPLANHPDLQPHYHRLDWLIRGMSLKRKGFVNDATDLSRHSKSQEAKRLINLLGGPDAATQFAKKALLEQDDPRWAATLATYVLRAKPEHEGAKSVRVDAFRTIASSTTSANERNYLLTAVLEETKGVNYKKVLSDMALQLAKDRPSADLLSEMSLRYKVEKAKTRPLAIKLSIVDEKQPHYLLANYAALVYSDDFKGKVNAHIVMDRSTLEQLWASKLSWSEAIEKELITVKRGRKGATTLARLID